MRAAAIVMMLAACSSPASTAPPPQNVAPPSAPPSVPALPVVRSFSGIDLVESDNSTIHTHGGPPATLGQATLRFAVRDHRAHVVGVRKLELLEGSCNTKVWSTRKPLVVARHEPYGARNPSLTANITSLTLPSTPDVYMVRVVMLDTVDVYNACDRFAFAMVIEVDGVLATVEIPLRVEREEP